MKTLDTFMIRRAAKVWVVDRMFKHALRSSAEVIDMVRKFVVYYKSK